MKKLYFSLVSIFLTLAGQAQIVNIPDANFKNRLVNTTCATLTPNGQFFNADVDTNNDGEIQVSEAAAVYRLMLDNSDIASLEGISAFTNCKELLANSNNITTADLGSLSSLTLLQIAYNQLTQITIPANVTYLEANDNQLSSLDFLSGIPLTLLDISNNEITTFNLTNPSLQALYIDGNQLTSLDISALNVTLLSCGNNQLTQLLLNTGIESLFCSHNQLATLDLSGVALIALDVSYNQLTELTIPPFKVDNSYDITYYAGVHISGNLYTSVANLPTFVDAFTCDDSQLLSLVIPQMNWGADEQYHISNNGQLQRIDARLSGLCEYDGQSFQCHLTISDNPNLAVICVNEVSLTPSNQQYFAGNNNPDLVLSTYCDFTPGGNYNTTLGNVRYNFDGTNCTTASTIASGVRINLATSPMNYPLGAVMSDYTGAFTAYSTNYSTGVNVKLTPQFENPYYSITPASYTTAFSGYFNTENADFCITPNGVHPDLEVTIIPTGPARPGFDAFYKIHYENKGTVTQSGTVTLDFEDDILDLVSANPATATQTTNSLSWNFSDLAPFESRDIALTLNVNSPLETPAVNIDDILDFTATVASVTDETPADNTFDFDQIVVGSYDPNDKTVSRESIGVTQLDDYLYYTVRFQNTGTFFAENVVISDMLSPKLNLATLQPVSASHAYRARLNNNNKLEFIFEGINLPAMVDDEPASHGYVTFKIKPKSTLVIGDVIENEAGIYFDFNAPIVTNTVTTTVTALGTDDINTVTFNLYPNPAAQSVTIRLQENMAVETIAIFNLLGQKVKSVAPRFENNVMTIDVADLNTGTYFIQLTSDKGKTTRKLIKS